MLRLVLTLLLALAVVLHAQHLRAQAQAEHDAAAEASDDVLVTRIVQLSHKGIKRKDIARMLGLSRSKLYRLLSKARRSGASVDLFSEITDDELADIIRDLKQTGGLPHVGAALVTGYLRSLRILVPRHRVREALRAADPEGVERRLFRGAAQRRVYRVRGPMSLWHADGNHKLIRCVCVDTRLRSLTALSLTQVSRRAARMCRWFLAHDCVLTGERQQPVTDCWSTVRRRCSRHWSSAEQAAHRSRC